MFFFHVHRRHRFRPAKLQISRAAPTVVCYIMTLSRQHQRVMWIQTYGRSHRYTICANSGKPTFGTIEPLQLDKCYAAQVSIFNCRGRG